MLGSVAWHKLRSISKCIPESNARDPGRIHCREILSLRWHVVAPREFIWRNALGRKCQAIGLLRVVSVLLDVACYGTETLPNSTGILVGSMKMFMEETEPKHILYIYTIFYEDVAGEARRRIVYSNRGGEDCSNVHDVGGLSCCW